MLRQTVSEKNNYKIYVELNKKFRTYGVCLDI